MKSPSLEELERILGHERQSYVWHQRHCVMPPRSQNDLAEELHVNRSRIGQLDNAAAKKLRDPRTWIDKLEIDEAERRAQYAFVKVDWDAINKEGTKRFLQWLDRWDSRIRCELLGCYMERAYAPSQERCPNITRCRIGTRLLKSQTM
jgi:hypothetical protein